MKRRSLTLENCVEAYIAKMRCDEKGNPVSLDLDLGYDLPVHVFNVSLRDYNRLVFSPDKPPREKITAIFHPDDAERLMEKYKTKAFNCWC